MGAVSLIPVDMVEIVTLADNYVDLVSMDNTAIVNRAASLKGLVFSNSILAEHGFSALLRTTDQGTTRSLLMDFGMSEDVAARNAEALGLDLSGVTAAALSHGHLDHFMGMARLGALVGKKGIPLAVHPAAFQESRWVEPLPGLEVIMPVITREKVRAAGFEPLESREPVPLLDGRALFLGEIPRRTAFEKGMPNAFRREKGEKIQDPLEDDSAVVMNLAGKGLVVVSGCAHAGIVNTVLHAREVTGVDRIHVIMGGFHLSGPIMAGALDSTAAAIRDLAPDHVVPTHCTGRGAVMAIERALPGAFLLNMSGTTLRFA